MVVGEYWLLPVTGVGLFLITQVSRRFILSCQVAFIIWCLVRLGANRESHLVWGSSTYPTLCSCDGYANLYVDQSLCWLQLLFLLWIGLCIPCLRLISLLYLPTLQLQLQWLCKSLCCPIFSQLHLLSCNGLLLLFFSFDVFLLFDCSALMLITLLQCFFAHCFAPLQTDAFPTTSYQCSESLLPLMHSVWVIISLFSLQDKVVPLVMTWRKVGR